MIRDELAPLQENALRRKVLNRWNKVRDLVWGHIRLDLVYRHGRDILNQHINFLQKIAIHKGIFHIKLAKWPMIRNCLCKNNSNSGGFNSWAKNIVETNAKLLSVSFCNKAGLETIDRTICKIFDAKNLFRTYNIFAWRSGYLTLSVIFEQSSKLLIHGSDQTECLAAG